MHIHTEIREAALAENRHRLAAAAERHRLLEEARESRARRAAERQLEAAETITIRRATPADAPALARLAALDSTRRLEGEILVALVGGELAAGLSLTDGRVVSDPFRLTAEMRDLLELRRSQLAAGDADADAGWLRRALRRRGRVTAAVGFSDVEGSCC